MTMDLKTLLPQLTPKAISWVEAQSSYVRSAGLALNEKFCGLARSVGVQHPDLIRIMEVATLPLPDDPELRQVALATGLLGPDIIGLTVGYGIYICQGHGTVRLLSHEFRHIYQYEQAGSIAAFIPAYLHQIATEGYQEAPLEKDARENEKLSV